MDSDLFPVSLTEQIAEVEREIQLRERVYPRFVEQKRMRQETADQRMRRMEAVLATLRALEEGE